MLPEIEIMGISIQTYGVMTLLGAVAAILYCTVSVRRRGLDPDAG